MSLNHSLRRTLASSLCFPLRTCAAPSGVQASSSLRPPSALFLASARPGSSRRLVLSPLPISLRFMSSSRPLGVHPRPSPVPPPPSASAGPVPLPALLLSTLPWAVDLFLALFFLGTGAAYAFLLAKGLDGARAFLLLGPVLPLGAGEGREEEAREKDQEVEDMGWSQLVRPFPSFSPPWPPGRGDISSRKGQSRLTPTSSHSNSVSFFYRWKS